MLSKHVFPGAKPGKGLSTGALIAVLQRMQGNVTQDGVTQDAVTVHGFRSSFRTLTHMVGGRGTAQLSP
jgi:hypothetical protein